MTAEKPWLMSDADLSSEREQFSKSYFGGDGHIFQVPYGAGYWLYGVEWIDDKGWLAFEFLDCDESPSAMDHSAAIEACKKGTELPAKYYLIDHVCVAKVFDNCVRKYGESGLDEMDLPRADECLQGTILGEIRYG